MKNAIDARAGSRRAAIIDCAAIVVLTCVLIFPLFRLKYYDNWGSIESTFISDARMLLDHLPHPGWQPLWYCGTRFDYIYPPALRYGTALTALVFKLTTARAYHLCIGALYALGIGGVYWLAFTGSRSRFEAWLAAAMTALLSPSLFLVPALGKDSPFNVPQRLHALIQYGEGPHISALAIMAFALASSFVALRGWNIWRLIISGILCAAIVAHNFYGATALAMLFPILAWAVWLELRENAIWLRSALIAAIAYGLSAFWLTPSYVKYTLINLQWVAQPRSPWAGTIAALCVLIFCSATFLISRRLKSVAWPVFIYGSAFFLAIYVLTNFYFQYTFAGNGARLAPELDMALLMVAAHALAQASKHRILKWGVAAMLVAASYPVVTYFQYAWVIFPRASVTARCEYKLAKWMHEHMPNARSVPTGSNRFWWDAWDDNAELSGGSDQGMMIQILPFGITEIAYGTDPLPSILWMQATGVDAIIVPEKNSQEIYHDIAHPERFRSALPVLYDDRQGNVIYGIPRRYPSIARVVDRALAARLTPHDINGYVNAIEKGPDAPTTTNWHGFDALDVTAATAQGQSILVQETYDPYWRAYENGKALHVSIDALGFMLIETSPGSHAIHLKFETPVENKIGRAITALTCVSLLALLVFQWRRRRSRSPRTAY